MCLFSESMLNAVCRSLPQKREKHEALSCSNQTVVLEEENSSLCEVSSILALNGIYLYENILLKVAVNALLYTWNVHRERNVSYITGH